MSAPTRTKVLSGFNHRRHLWRSDTTGTLYKFRGMWGHWGMYYEGRWEFCYDDRGARPFDLHGTDGETFMRVGAIL